MENEYDKDFHLDKLYEYDYLNLNKRDTSLINSPHLIKSNPCIFLIIK